MSVYIIADPRFNDVAAAQDVGLQVEEYNQFIVDRINSVVGDTDWLVFLGNIAEDTTNLKHYIDQIKGSKDIYDFAKQTLCVSRGEAQELGFDYTYNVDCFTEEKVGDTKYYVTITSDLDYNAYLSLSQSKDPEYYWAMPESRKNMGERLKNHILNISLRQWDYYPIKYDELPNIIDNIKLFNSMEDIK